MAKKKNINEEELIFRAQQDDKNAISALIKSYTPLIIKMANKFREDTFPEIMPPDIGIQDLIRWGEQGFIKGLKNLDTSYSLGGDYIRKAIYRNIEKSVRKSRGSNPKRDNLYSYERLNDLLEGEKVEGGKEEIFLRDYIKVLTHQEKDIMTDEKIEKIKRLLPDKERDWILWIIKKRSEGFKLKELGNYVAIRKRLQRIRNKLLAG